MKRFVSSLLVGLISTLCFGAYDASENLVINGDAENPTDFYNWYHSAGTAIVNDSSTAPGTQCFEMVNNDWDARDIRTVPFPVVPNEKLQLSFTYKTDLDAMGVIWALIRWWEEDNNVGFLDQTIISVHPTDGGWVVSEPNEVVVHPDANYCDVAFYIMTFISEGNVFRGNCRIDDIHLYREATVDMNMQPADDACDVGLHTKLEWDAMPSDTSFDIYLGLDGNSVGDADQLDSEYLDTVAADMGRMEYAVTLQPYRNYFWRADANAGGTVTTGSVAHFSTAFDVIEDTLNSTAVVHTIKDNLNHTTDCLKVISNPNGGYLGTYHHYDGYEFRGDLATSTDLVNWTYVVTLAPNSSMPTIVYHPETGGYFISHEQWGNPGSSGSASLRFRYYPSTAHLLAGTATRDYTAPHSAFNPSNLEGTPNIYSVSADGDTIEVGFHYFNSSVSADRIAGGTLSNFLSGSPSWTSWVETTRNNQILNKNIAANIGDRDYGQLFDKEYTIQEAQYEIGVWESWRSWFYDHDAQEYYMIRLKDIGSGFATSNGTFTHLIGPSGKDAVVTTYFLFSGAAMGNASLLFYTDLQTTAWEPIPGDGDSGVSAEQHLRWQAGRSAVEHDVYLGTNATDVANADTDSELYFGRIDKPHINIGLLFSNTQYFWRVDEILSDGTMREGDVWDFTTSSAGGVLVDIAVIAEHWLKEDHAGCIGDLSGNCRIDFYDYAELLD